MSGPRRNKWECQVLGGRLVSLVCWLFWYAILSGLVIVAATIRFDAASQTATELVTFMRLTAMVFGLFVLLSVALRMASVGTIHRVQFPRTKWQNALVKSQPVCGALILAFLAAALIAETPWFCWFLMPLVFASHVWFFGNLGLVLSISCGSTFRARLYLFVALLAVVLAGWMLAYVAAKGGLLQFNEHRDYSYRFNHSRGWIDDHGRVRTEDLLNPPQVWWRMTIPSWELQQPRGPEGEEPYYLDEEKHFDGTSIVINFAELFGWKEHVVSAIGYFSIGFLLWLLSFAPNRLQGARA